MQAPHSESSQPSFDPVSPTASRTAVSRRRARLDLDRVGDAVDRERGGDLHAGPPCSAGLAGIGTSPPRARATAASIARRAITAAIARR